MAPPPPPPPGPWDPLPEGLLRSRRSTGVIAKAEEEVHMISDKTGMNTWMVITIIVVLMLVIAGLAGWCAWRFFRKKRKAKDDAAAKGGIKPRSDDESFPSSFVLRKFP